MPARPVAISLRLYRALARAFPQEFKNAYGDELVQAAEDAVEPIWRRHGAVGLVRLLVDIGVRVPAEHLAEMRQDVRYGLRMLARSPGFTVVALISLALGICIATCALSEMNGMVLRTVPAVAAPGQLAALQAPISYPDYRRYREQKNAFSASAAYVAPVPFAISVDGRTQRVWGQLVTGSYFTTLGVGAALGRVFTAEDDQLGQAPTVVVSYRFWQEHLGGDEAAIGKALRVNGHPATVIGIGPKDFLGASPMMLVADLWVPISAGTSLAPELAGNVLERRDRAMFHFVGRLRSGVNLASAEAELDAVARQIERDSGEPENADQSRRVTLVDGGKILPLRKQDVPFFTTFFVILASLVMLIACANVANMMVARATSRRREIAVRVALGASRARIVRQLLTESMLVAAAAGVLGFLTSWWLMHLMARQPSPFPMPVSYDFQPDARVLLFAIALTAIAGLAFGLTPALQATRNNLAPALKEGGTVLLRRFRRLSLRNTLMVTQLAGSLTLLVILGLLAFGIQNTVGIQQGFNSKNLYLISLDPVRDGLSGEQAAPFLTKLLERVRMLPGITSACLTDTVPVAINVTPWVRFSFTGPNAATRRAAGAVKNVVGKDYFETTGVPILTGRAFREEDEADNASAVIVSATFVRNFWAGANPVGQRLEIESGENGGGLGGWPGDSDYRRGILDKGRRAFEIVGVAGDVTNSLIVQHEHPAIYFPLRQADYAEPSLLGTTLMVRAAPGVDAIRAVQNTVSAMDSRITPFDARSMTEQINHFMTLLRVATWSYGVIGVFGLLLAAVGLAGVTAYSVTRRRHEIGIRIALGARARNVLGLVMKEGLALVTVGTVIGMAGAWAAARMLTAMEATVGTVTSTSTSDPVVLLGAPVLLASLTLLSCFIPARNSMRIDPAVALRQE